MELASLLPIVRITCTNSDLFEEEQWRRVRFGLALTAIRRVRASAHAIDAFRDFDAETHNPYKSKHQG